MATSALKKITTEAKSIRRKHPSMSWKSAIKKAGAAYRAGTIKKKKSVGAAKKKRVGTVKRKAPARKRTVGNVSPYRLSESGPAPTNMQLLKGAQRLRMEQVARWEVKKLQASTKTEKKQIQKKLVELKSALRRVNKMLDEEKRSK